MIEPVFEKGYPSYDAVNRKTVTMSDDEMIIKLHQTARVMEDADFAAGKELRQIADRFAEFVKMEKEARHYSMQG